MGINLNNSNHYGKPYDHDIRIVDSAELQLVNGFYCSPNNINAFLDYRNYYNDSVIDYPNYNLITLNNDDKRYICFQYSNLLNDTNNYI